MSRMGGGCFLPEAVSERLREPCTITSTDVAEVHPCIREDQADDSAPVRHAAFKFDRQDGQWIGPWAGRILVVISMQFPLLSARGTASPMVLDGAFAPTVTPGGSVQAILPLADGSIVLAGTFTGMNESKRFGIGRLTHDGSTDPRFAPQLGATPSARLLATGPNGTIWVAGDFSTVNSRRRAGLVRLNSDGSVDLSFEFNTSLNGSIKALAPYPDGRLLLAGSFSQTAEQSRNYLLRLNPDGSVDPRFLPELRRSFAIEGGVDCLTLQTNGEIVAGGTFVVGSETRHLARVNSEGRIDASFNAASPPMLYVYAVALQSDGKLLVGGVASASDAALIIRLNSDGRPDPQFILRQDFKGAVQALVPDDEGGMFVGGQLAATAGAAKLLRLTPSGDLDLSFRSALGGNGAVGITVLAMGPHRELLAAGQYTTVDGSIRSGLARFKPERGLVFTSISKRSDGWVCLKAVGQAGHTYVLERSGNWSNWKAVSTNTAPGEEFELLDRRPGTQDQHYYRAMADPR